MGYIKAFITISFLSFHLFHADEWVKVFALGASSLELIYSMSLDATMVIQSVQ